MTQPFPILFVCHEGTYTGAPMMLLHFLRWLRDNAAVEPEIAILRDGPLTEQFRELGPTTVLGDTVEWPGTTPTETNLTRVGLLTAAQAIRRARVRRELGELRAARTVYLNSSSSLRLLPHLPNLDTTIAHVHELRSGLLWSLEPEDAALLGTRVDHVIAAADCVADNLVDRQGVDRANITRVYEFIDPSRTLAPPHDDRATIRAGLGLAEDTPVIGGSGFGDWRKGLDLFVQLARELARRGRDDIHLVWVGDRAGGLEADQIDFDIRSAGVGDQLHLVGLQPHSSDWYRAFDVFALTSREDPYPLVGLETAILEVPMLCFDGAGGMSELIARGPAEGLGEVGLAVPYLDVEAMAEAAITLLDDPARRAAMGRLAGELVLRDHQVEVAAPQLLDVIERVLGRRLH